MTRFSLYYYGWYRRERWAAHDRLFTPRIGLYDSRNPLAVSWQFQSIIKTAVDSIVIEIPVTDDINFQCISENLKLCIQYATENKIEYSFLVDLFEYCAGVNDYEVVSNELDALFAWLTAQGCLNRALRSECGKPIVYFFMATPPSLAKAITDRYSGGYDIIHVAWLPTWGQLGSAGLSDKARGLIDGWFPGLLAGDRSVEGFLASVGYIPFWQNTKDVRNVRGHAAVIPGYDDTRLGRDPQLAPVISRDGGRNYVEQFRRAVDSGAEHILIYGWNEYFESTNIEPTLEYGDFYVDLTRQLIRQAKSGEAIHYPEDMGAPRPVPPLYLSDELELAAQRHEDRVPRWDQDDYVAEVSQPEAVYIQDGCVCLRGVRVRNAGIKAWPIASGGAEIKLGGRLVGANGVVASEGRSSLGVRDIEAGEELKVDLSIEMRNAATSGCIAIVDVVWENIRWFNNEVRVRIGLAESMGHHGVI